MDARRWQRLQELFEAARRLDDARRQQYLDEACGDDPGLRDQVESLILHDRAAAATEERRIADAVERLTEPPRSVDRTGRRVGAYRIVRELGTGGMAAVWLAVRDDGVHQAHAAVKIVRGVPGKLLLDRFQDERRILATLEHPNIARLLDGGSTDDGIPYVVMEYVDGLPIDRYCDERRLDTAARLELFRAVCSAVQYAHSRLIVHRDIKPGNILVTAEGVPKLLDFGIAKLLDPTTSGSGRPETATAVRLLTPEYASPEQVRGETITTATDVYSLGVLLYELLSGNRPYRPADRDSAELVRQICELDPERPSTAVTRDPQAGRATDPSRASAAEIARARGAPPERLRRQLAGDLDNIVLMALRKEPGRRYASPQLLADDIGRHLDGLPVAARPSTLGYRTAKFLRRHLAAAAAAVAVVVIVASLVGFYTVRLAAERDVARREKATADEVSQFLVGLFEKADPSEGESVKTVADVLDAGAERVRTDLTGQPAVQASLMVMIGTAYKNLDRFDEAKAMLSEGLELRRELFGKESPEVADALMRLGQTEDFLANYDEAKTLYEESMAITSRVEGPDALTLANGLNNLAIVHYRTADYEKSRELWERALAIRRRHQGPSHEAIAVVQGNLGIAYHSLGRFADARQAYADGLEMLAALGQSESPRAAAGRINLASVEKDLGHLEAALELERAALAIRERYYGAEAGIVGETLQNLGNTLQELGHPQQAREHYLRAMRIQQSVHEEGHPSIARLACDLAIVSGDLEGPAAAIPQMERALAQLRRAMGDDHPRIGHNLINLAKMRDDAGDHAEALRTWQQALDQLEASLGADHVDTADAVEGLAGAALRAGRPEEARALYERALRLRQGTFDADDDEIVRLRQRLGEIDGSEP